MMQSEINTMPENHEACDSSPDSVICTDESNFSLFSSSASASADRSSFASDIIDQESTASETLQVNGLRKNKSFFKNIKMYNACGQAERGSANRYQCSNHAVSEHLAEHEVQDTCSGPDLVQDLNKPCKVEKYRKGDRPRAIQTEDKEGESLAIDSARTSFFVAVQEKRLQSNVPPKNQDLRRKLSLDFGDNVTSISPRLEAVKRNSISRQPGAFPSPETPNYRGIQKGWNSERVASHHNGNRRRGNNAFILSLHSIDNTRRTLPSKWEDAERWIFSPRAGDAVVKPSAPQPQRRPKAKSGPLGPPGGPYHLMYSPAMVDGGNARSFMAGSPFASGVKPSNGLTIQCGDHGGRTEPCMGRSVSLHGCSELMNQTLLPSSEDQSDEKLDGIKDAATDVSRVASRRDMATQMSPNTSPQSPLKRLPSTPSLMSILEFQSSHSSKSEARDFGASERITVTSWSIKSRSRHSGKSSGSVHDWTKKAMDSWCSAWDASDTAKSLSKFHREEARISAWENLQKAKAEAAIRKIEMKLEKKRSSSMEKIINKLRTAQKRAQDMRNRVLDTQSHQVNRTSRKAISLHRPRQISSLSGCFACHAFESG